MDGQENTQFWYLYEETDIERIFAGVKEALEEARSWFGHFESRQAAAAMILDGTADRYSVTNVMHYHTAKMLAEMGCQAQVYERIKDSQAAAVARLAEELAGELAERGGERAHISGGNFYA